APLQGGRFDVVWSFGVLHHMPSPRAAFRTIVRFARPTGGLVAIWVYGYRGMALTYRLSHMRSLHRLVRRMSTTARVRVSRAIAAVLSVLYFEPLKVAARLGLRRYIGVLPLGAYVEYGWSARTAAVHRVGYPWSHRWHTCRLASGPPAARARCRSRSGSWWRSRSRWSPPSPWQGRISGWRSSSARLGWRWRWWACSWPTPSWGSS